VQNLTSEQRAFILGGGVNPKDVKEVQGLTRRFNGEFSVGTHWGTMRRLLTNLQRKERRNGNGNGVVV